jgi:CheY-like chemotaxis protein
VTTTLLAVDDSKTMRKVLEITFAGEDYRTVLAQSSSDALSKLANEKPAVALVDAQLGAESGYDLCQSIKRERPGTPVIILSSKQTPYDRARGASAGADDFMDKPFDTQQLIDKVAVVLRKVSEAPAPIAARPAAQPPEPAAARAAGPAPAHTLAFGSAPAPRPAVAAPAARPAAPASPVRPAAPAAASPAAARTPPQRAAPTPVSTGTQPSMLSPGVPASRPAPVAAPAARRPPAAAAARPGAGTLPGGTAARPAAPAAQPAARPPAAAAPSAAAVEISGDLKDKLEALGLSAEQIQGVLELSREVIEQVVWEVVPVLAETMIEEEIKRLTRE